MKKNQVEVLVIKPNGIYTKVLNNDYTAFKEEINILSPIDCIHRKIGDKYFDIWLDDEGLFKVNDDGTINGIAFCKNAMEILAGNIIIANSDENGKTLSLSDADITLIKSALGTFERDIVVEYDTSIGLCKMRFDKGSVVLRYEI